MPARTAIAAAMLTLAAMMAMTAPASPARAAGQEPTPAKPHGLNQTQDRDRDRVVDRVPPARQAADLAILKAMSRDGFLTGRHTSATGSLPYRLLPPAELEPGRRYPLVLVLHGSGAVGDDNRSQLGALAMSWATPALRAQFPAYILAPQFPERSANYAPSAEDGWLSAQAGPNLPTLLDLVEQLKRQYPVDPGRVYATGFSMGASAATQALLERPGLFAGAVAFSGIAPERALAGQLAPTPLLIVHGDADTENPIEPDRAMVAALRRQPGAKVRYLEYRGMEHQVPGDMLLGAVWRAWLFEQRAEQR